MSAVLVDVDQRPETEALYADARNAYRAALNEGREMTGREVGALFPKPDGEPRTDRWGRQRIREAKAEAAAEVTTVPDPLPPVVADEVPPPAVVVVAAEPELTPEATEAATAPTLGAKVADMIERAVALIMILAVGAVAGRASYDHLRHLADLAGEEALAPWLPVSVDGLIVVGAILMRRARRAGEAPDGWCWASLGLGLFGSLAGNIAAADPASPLPTLAVWAVAAWPTVAFFVAHEVLQRILEK